MSHSLITATVGGRSIGVFDTRSGGGSSSEVTKRRPGGGGIKLNRNPKRDTEDVTITREREREDIELARWLRTQVGRADASVNEQPLDDDEVPWGKPTTWTGVLQNVDDGEVDSDSNDPRFLSLTFVMREVV